MLRRPPRSTRTDTLFPYATLFRSGRIAGTALVGAQMITTLAAKCDTSAPPAMMFIDGDEDPLASYDGNATLMSLPASAAFWAQANGCNMTPRREALADEIGRAHV